MTDVAEKPAKPKRRIVKKAETVRQKAEKSANQPPKRQGVVWLALKYIGAPFRFIGRKLAKLGRFKVLRIIGRILWPTYFRNSWKELKQVTWPGRRESWQLTGAVLLFSAIFGVLIALVDYLLDKLFKEVLLK
jgi:preprotein translocase SecE subunit